MLTKLQKQDIFNCVFGTQNFCGSWVEAVKDYCFEEGIDWKSHQKEIDEIAFKALEEYYIKDNTMERD